MIHTIELTLPDDRIRALDYLRLLKDNNSNISVVDVGGSHNCWANEYVTHVIDFLPYSEGFSHPLPPSNARYFIGNISNISVWEEVLEYVKVNGKFDFLSCTHTLEDTDNVSLICDMFGRVAKEGYVVIPSKYVELKKFEDNWRGFIHHRWIFDAKNGQVTAYPKQGFLENVSYIEDWVNNNPVNGNNELQFFWKDEVGLKVVNDGHLGPTIQHVLDYYKELVT